MPRTVSFRCAEQAHVIVQSRNGRNRDDSCARSLSATHWNVDGDHPSVGCAFRIAESLVDREHLGVRKAVLKRTRR